jgi:hypothetical protein
MRATLCHGAVAWTLHTAPFFISLPPPPLPPPSLHTALRSHCSLFTPLSLHTACTPFGAGAVRAGAAGGAGGAHCRLR